MLKFRPAVRRVLGPIFAYPGRCSSPGRGHAQDRCGLVIETVSQGEGKHVVLYGLFGIGNTGNDATLEVTLSELRKRIPGARFTIVASKPDVIAPHVDAPCVPIRPASRTRSTLPGPFRRLQAEADRWSQARELMRTADCLAVPGTGILDDFGSTVIGHAYPLLRWCYAARLEGKSVKLLSIGAGPAERAWSRRLFRKVALLADHRSYRDEKSRAFVQDVLKVDAAKDRVTPDLVFGMEIDVPPPRDVIERVGIGVMEYHNWLGSEDADNDAYGPYMEKLTAFCTELLNRGLELRILTGDVGDQRAIDDLLARLRKTAPGRERQLVAPQIRSLRELCTQIGQTDAVVATRFHTIVGAMKCARPAISIGYGAKNRAVMTAFGQGHYCHDIWNFDLDALRTQFDELNLGRAAISERLVDVRRAMDRQVQDHFDNIAAEIEGRERPPCAVAKLPV